MADIPRDPIEDIAAFEAFGCAVPFAAPPTPDRVDPDVFFFRDVFADGTLDVGGGVQILTFGFEDPEDPNEVEEPFPSPLIRVREGQVVHVVINTSRGTHTIHHHGIEPTPMNDGVGHTSFEAEGTYTYQWYAAHAGTYHYHCHKNTVLHFELGMYGPLIIDPPTGPGTVYHRDEIVTYDHEAIWVMDDIDPVYHNMEHDVGLICPFDPVDHGLNRFDPQYFVVTGIPSQLTETDPGLVQNMQVGEVLLARCTNAAYGVTSVKVNGLRAEIIEHDGRTLGKSPEMVYSQPIPLDRGEVRELPTAGRFAMLVKPTRPGDYRVDFEFEKAWVDRGETFTASTWIHVTGDPAISFAELGGVSPALASVAVSQDRYPDGADVVIVATGDNWPDSLAAPALAGAYDAPLLLTGGQSLDQAVADEITRLGAGRVYILGGTLAVSSAVQVALNGLVGGSSVTRLAGVSRYDTAVEIAQRIVTDNTHLTAPWDGTVLIASGANFADALTVGALSYRAGWPVLLTAPNTLNAATAQFISEHNATRAIILGGTLAVSAQVETQLNQLLGAANVDRLAGTTRYDTALEIGRYGVQSGHLDNFNPGIAGGVGYVDALIGAVAQGSIGSPLYTTPAEELPTAVADELNDMRLDVVRAAFYGTTATISMDVRNQIRAILSAS